MKISLNWLKNHINIKAPTEDIVDKLNLTGTEVESVQNIIDDKIIVAKIENIKPHPNADRLQLVEVFTGKERINLVCGAKNIAIGQYVPLAQVGAKLPELEIKPINIRGVDSYGMLCSEKELGLSNNHEGILLLDSKKHILGASIAKYFSSDTILELEITPNRGDCLSHLGIARELSAIYNLPIVKSIPSTTIDKTMPQLDIKVLDKRSCPQYYAVKIGGITVKESPRWLKDKLNICGINSVNNIVDIANFIMLDNGQPLHIFDAKIIHNSNIVVRYAKQGEKLLCLDNINYNLQPDTLLVSDDIKPLAIAGVIGGIDSAVNNKTREIIIEAAEFDSANIRNTMKSLRISTEASYRFERKIDSQNIKNSLINAMNLIIDLAGGKTSSSITYVGTNSKLSRLKIDYVNINKLLGLHLKTNEINSILSRLGFKVTKDECIIPSWRHDITIWQDLAEEVGRIYGYNKIKPLSLKINKISQNTIYHFKEYLKDILVEDGFCEVFNYSFTSDTNNLNDLLEVANPLQPENKYLRANLTNGILKSIARNPSFDPIKIFEIGNVFTKTKESTELSIAIAQNKKIDFDNVLTYIAKKLNLSLSRLINKGNLAQIDSLKLKKYKIRKQNVTIFSIDINTLLSNSNIAKYNIVNIFKQHTYKPISKFESVARDMAFVVENNINGSIIQDEILNIDDRIVLVEQFDEFSSEKFGKDKKNIAYHIWLQETNKSIDAKAADDIIKKIIIKLASKFKAEFRTH